MPRTAADKAVKQAAKDGKDDLQRKADVANFLSLLHSDFPELYTQLRDIFEASGHPWLDGEPDSAFCRRWYSLAFLAFFRHDEWSC